ncbi:hypothetical protein [Legionella rowbothamii]|uniref:hypothetical protein n=1 Tax=Legionella rowbothamii TaxID=96229 RepID=UPI0010564ED6|nr:hypothetical protein [Legionella rowbothamii]
MFRDLILQMRRTLQQHNINVEQEWINVKDFASAQLYKTYFDQNYNRFWTFEDPQYIARCRLYSENKEEFITIEDISNAFTQTCDLTDLITTPENEFLSIFQSTLQSKSQANTPVLPTFAF